MFRLLPSLLLLVLVSSCAVGQEEPRLTEIETFGTAPGGMARRADVQAFVARMVREHGFDRDGLLQQFSLIRTRPDIIATMRRPAEKTLPWHAYRDIFLDEPRIANGERFWETHRETLARAEAVYGVAPQTIVAIMGVETRYGRVTGRHGVLEALSTLAFDYPPRSPFFTRELEAFLLLCREEGIDPLTLQGSYAGAMGIPQFMPSSYRAYAVDFNGDGQRNLWQDPVDAIGSAANYLAVHRWVRGTPIAIPASLAPEATPDGLQGRDYKATFDSQVLQQNGVRPMKPLPSGQPVFVFELEGVSGPQHWIGLPNFYVVTRYNRSPLYVMAVHELGHAIEQRLSVKNQ